VHSRTLDALAKMLNYHGFSAASDALPKRQARNLRIGTLFIMVESASVEV